MKILFLMLMSLSLWANIGNIMAIKGSAEVKRSDTLLLATNGMELHEGDKIVTASKSRVQVMLKDDTIVTIGASSTFGFDEFVYDGTKKSKVRMSANRGFFRSLTGKIGKIAPERFKVKTTSATIGIRGTDFSGEIFADKEVFKCYSGAIYVIYDDGEKEIEAGKMLELRKGKFVKKEDILAPKNLINKIKSVNEDQLPTEVISDITQIIEDPDNEALKEPVDGEPFNINANTQDRPVQF